MSLFCMPHDSKCALGRGLCLAAKDLRSRKAMDDRVLPHNQEAQEEPSGLAACCARACGDLALVVLRAGLRRSAEVRLLTAENLREREGRVCWCEQCKRDNG